MPSANTDPETGLDHDAPIGDIRDAHEIQSQRTHNHQLPPIHFYGSASSTATKNQPLTRHRRHDSGSEWSEDLLHEGLEEVTRGNQTVLPYTLFADSEYGVEIISPDDSRGQEVANMAHPRRHSRSRSKSQNKDGSSLSDLVDSGDNIVQGKRPRRHRHRRRSTSRSRSSDDTSGRHRRHKSKSRSRSSDCDRHRGQRASLSQSGRSNSSNLSRSGRSKSSRSKSDERRRELRGGKKPTRRHIKKQVSFTVEGAEEQTNIDESERLSVYLDNAAKRIQNKFRHSRLEDEDFISESEEPTDSDSEDEGTVVTEMDAERIQHIVTNMFILLFSIAMMMKRWIIKCITGCTSGNQKRSGRRRKSGNNDDDDDPELVDPDDIGADGGDIMVDGGGDFGNMQGQPQPGPTTTGPPAPTPGGMESMMASQAASSAASGAASGVSAGVAAGAAAAGTATSAMAAAGIAASATQLATAAVVGTSVVVASSVVASGALVGTPEPFPIISTCGIASPAFHGGIIGLSFEGFDREFDAREQELVESLVVESYNLVTRGSNQASLGCMDKYQREMQNSTTTDQVFTNGNETAPSTLDMAFDSWVICNGCPDDLPMFGRFASNPQISRRLQSAEDSRLNVEVDLDLLDQLLKEVVRKIVNLTDYGELGEGFIPSKIAAKGPLLSSTTLGVHSVGGNDTSVVLLNLPIGYEDGTSTDVREVIFPEKSFCGSMDPQFYPGFWRVSLEGVARAIFETEKGIIENLMLQTYNSISVGSAAQLSCGDRYQREMSRARLVEQQFVDAEGPNTVSSLDMTFKTWLICNGCSNVIPLFGGKADGGAATDFSYDYGMMEDALREVIARMIGLINRDTLPSSLIPTKASILSPSGQTGGSGGQDGQNGGQSTAVDGPLLNVPIVIETDENGEIVVNIPKPSACGLLDPDFYPAELRMTFEGFERVFSEEEAALIQPLILQSYNQLTKGPNTGPGVCVDPYKREMTSADLADQTFSVPPGGDERSVLDLTFDTWVTCDGCSEEETLFGGGIGRRLQEGGVGSGDMDLDFVEIHMEEVVAGIVDLVSTGALPAIFVPEKVYVKEKGPDGGSGSVLLQVPILVNYREGSGYLVQFPGPSQAPSMSMVPSTVPSDVPSLSMVPSISPSDIPSDMPSNVPSDVPSVIPSDSPSSVPTIVASGGPTSLPSESPSDSPSVLPSMSPSRIPSVVPSESPSMIPSVVPSEMPSTQYQGCFLETPTSPKMELYVGGQLSVADCQGKCEDFGFRYAGLSINGIGNGYHNCYCGDSYDTTAQVADSECINNCGGSWPCGGNSRTSVYIVGNHPSGGGYTFESNLYCDCHYDWYATFCGILPCTKDDFTNKVSDQASVKGCIAMCRQIGNKYAALHEGRQCYCSNSVRGGTFGWSGCTDTCTYGTPSGCLNGASSCQCGDGNQNSVYRTSTAHGCP